MGLTIHYSGGQALSRAKIDELINSLCRIAKGQKWQYWTVEKTYEDIYQTRFEKGKNNSTGRIVSERVKDEPEVVYKAFFANIDEGCETFEIGFNYRTLECAYYYRYPHMKHTEKTGFFCKTQYSKDFIGTHHTICMLLDHIKTYYVPDLEVHDEGGYFGKWDKKALGAEIKEWNAMIRGVGEQLKEAIEQHNQGKDEKDKVTMKSAVELKG